MNADEQLEFKRLKERVAALEALSWTTKHTPAQPQYREPTIEMDSVSSPIDAWEYREPTAEDARLFRDAYIKIDNPYTQYRDTQAIFKQLGFVRKVQP